MYNNILLKIIVFSALLSSLIACSSKKGDNILKNYKLISSGEIPLNFMLGTPYQLKVLDNYLIIADRIDNKILTFFDLNTGQLTKRIIDIGQGPKEMLMPIYMDIDQKHNTIGILQRQSGNYSEHQLSDLLEGDVNPSNKFNLGNVEKVLKIGNNYFAEGFYPNGNIGFYNNKGDLLFVENIFPGYLSQIDNISDRYRLGQGEICYNEVSNTFLYASYFTGDIDFFSFSNNRLERINGFSLDNNISTRLRNNPTDVNIRQDDIEHSIDIAYTSDYFYILYSGESMQKRQSAKWSYILQFDTKGQFIRCYKSDRKFFNICVTEDNSKMYAIILTDGLDYSLAEVIL